MSLNPARRLRGLRLLVTIPPEEWFGGVDRRFAVDMADELRRLGATLFEFDLGMFLTAEEPQQHEWIASAQFFRADVAIALPNAGYGIVCRRALWYPAAGTANARGN